MFVFFAGATRARIVAAYFAPIIHIQIAIFAHFIFAGLRVDVAFLHFRHFRFLRRLDLHVADLGDHQFAQTIQQAWNNS